VHSSIITISCPSGVWQALSPVYEALDAEKEKLWSTIQPRKIRTFLDERLTELKNLSSQYRSYEAYEHAKRLLQHYSKVCSLAMVT
jgi:dynein heavy chain 1